MESQLDSKVCARTGVFSAIPQAGLAFSEGGGPSLGLESVKPILPSRLGNSDPGRADWG